ncbi:MAG: hypothetical protein ACE5J3_13895 [Methanosarcinales archaeon]
MQYVEINETNVLVETLGIKTWLEFYGEDFIPNELINELCSKLKRHAKIAFNKKQITEYRAFYALYLLLSNNKDFQTIKQVFDVLYELFLLKRGKINEMDFLKSVDQLESLVFEKGLLKEISLTKEQIKQFEEATKGFNIDSAIKDSISKLS